MQSNLLKFVEMPPLGVLRPLLENESDSSLMLDSSAESGNENTELSSACSQDRTPEQVIIQCQNSTESQGSQVSVRDVSKSQSSSDNLHKHKFKGSTSLSKDKRYRICPLTQLHPSLKNDTCNPKPLTSSNKSSSKTEERSQQLTNYFDSQMLELSNRSAGNEFVSPIGSYEPHTESEKLMYYSSSESKVVVQAMPNLSFGNITALQQCMDDIKISRTPKNNSESGISETGSSERGFDNSGISKTEIFELPSSQTSEDDDFVPSSYSMKRIRKNHAFNLHIRRGRGKKLSDIDYIASAIPKVSSNVLRLIHYVLFGSYGSISTESALEKTKTNILHFSGFDFNEFSLAYKIKFKSLMRMPYPILLDMFKLLVGKPSVERSVMVRQLLKFCLKPTRRKQPLSNGPSEINNEAMIRELKKRILEGPSPVVKLERLSEEYIQRMIHIEVKDEARSSGAHDQNPSKKHVKPRYIVNGPGMKLKHFPKVVAGIYKARRRIINLLHVFLYGKPGSEVTNRLNILEFNGFLQRDKSFLERGVKVLKKFKKEELDQICDIFSLHSESGSKIKKIKKLLLYLQSPSLVFNSRRMAAEAPRLAENQTTQKLMMPANEILCNRPDPNIPRLRDFEKICFNIECAPPRDLTELNDLLFVNPSDVNEIHEKLLNFTPFPFDENSLEFDHRKTLLHYMGLPIVKKIANILDIPLWERYECEEELSLLILKFLMELKRPAEADKRVKVTSYPAKKKMKKDVPNSNYRPQILMVQKDVNFSSDQGESTYLPPGSNNLVHASNGFHVLEDRESGPKSAVIIKRISESSYSWTDLVNDGPVTISSANSEESSPLNEFVHHPSENQLELTIKEVICRNSMSTSLGDLLNKVLQHYPRFNLTYRTDFIKSKALEILHEIQECMVDSTLDTA